MDSGHFIEHFVECLLESQRTMSDASPTFFNTHTHTLCRRAPGFWGCTKGGNKGSGQIVLWNNTHVHMTYQILGGGSIRRGRKVEASTTQLHAHTNTATPPSLHTRILKKGVSGGGRKVEASLLSQLIHCRCLGSTKYSNTVSALHTQYLSAHVRLTVCSPSSSTVAAWGPQSTQTPSRHCAMIDSSIC